MAEREGSPAEELGEEGSAKQTGPGVESSKRFERAPAQVMAPATGAPSLAVAPKAALDSRG